MGDNTWNQTNVPAGLSNVVAIAAGGYHSLALKQNGTVAVWGITLFIRPTFPRLDERRRDCCGALSHLAVVAMVRRSSPFNR